MPARGRRREAGAESSASPRGRWIPRGPHTVRAASSPVTNDRSHEAGGREGRLRRSTSRGRPSMSRIGEARGRPRAAVVRPILRSHLSKRSEWRNHCVGRTAPTPSAARRPRFGGAAARTSRCPPAAAWIRRAEVGRRAWCRLTALTLLGAGRARKGAVGSASVINGTPVSGHTAVAVGLIGNVRAQGRRVRRPRKRVRVGSVVWWRRTGGHRGGLRDGTAARAGRRVRRNRGNAFLRARILIPCSAMATGRAQRQSAEVPRLETHGLV